MTPARPAPAAPESAPRSDASAPTPLFLSYSRRDIDSARRLFDALSAQGLQTWVDWDDIPPSADWWSEIERAIEAAQAVLVVLSPASVASTVCRREIAHALQHNKRVIPVVCAELDAQAQSDLARDEVGTALARLHWIHARAGDDFDDALSRLLQAIRTDLDWVRQHSRMLQRAIEWQQRARGRSLLLRGTELEAAEAWLAAGARQAPKPTSLQTEFVVASRLGAVSRRRRLWGSVGAAGLLLAGAALVASFQAATAELRRDEAGSRRLAALIPAAIEGDDTDLALLLGTLAHDTHPTAEAAHALMQALEVQRGRWAVPARRFAVDGVMAWSPDGRALQLEPCAAAVLPPDCGPTGRVWLDVTTLRPLEGSEAPPAAATSAPRWRLDVDPGGLAAGATVQLQPVAAEPAGAPLRFRLPPGELQAFALAPAAPRAALIQCLIRASGRHCDGRLQLLDLQAGRLLGGAVRGEHELDPLLSLSFLDDRWLASGGCGAGSPSEACLYGRTQLWTVDELEGLVAQGPGLRTAGGAVARIERSPDGRRFATLGSLGTLSLWTLAIDSLEASGALPSVLEDERRPAAAVRTRCDGVELDHPWLQVSALGLAHPQALCDAFAGLDLTRPLVVAWAPEAGRLAVGACERGGTGPACRPGRVRSWRLAPGRLEALPAFSVDGEVTALAWSADGEQLAVAHCAGRGWRACPDGATISLAAPPGDAPRVLARGLPGISALAIDAQGRRLAHASCHEFPRSGPPVDACATAAIRLLPLDGGALPVRDLGGPRAGVSSLAFTPDGERLVSGDVDGALSFWDLDAGYRIGPPLPWHHEPVEALHFDEAARLLAQTATAQSRWRARPTDWKRLACRLAGRDLSATERQRWVGADAPVRPVCSPQGEPGGPAPRSRWSAGWRSLVLRFEERRAGGG